MNISRYVRAIIGSFLGLRKKSEMEKDFSELNIVYLVVIGLLSVAIFIVGLIVLVSLISS